jgi:electron transport complex protein RnfC
LIEAVKQSGLVGLGGAGFPTAVKLAALKGGKVDKIVVNGAECEPYITSDTRTMLDNKDLILEAVKLIEKFAPSVTQFIFGVEANKPKCIAELKELFAANAKVVIKKLPARYPQGAEKVLVYNTTGLVIPEGKLPADVGAIVINVTSLAVLANYAKTGMPLVERVVTVDGSAIKSPKNVIAPIGTSLAEIIEFAGGYNEPVGKALIGGPMMGKCAASLEEPITKTTGSVLLFNEADSDEKEASNCIHCGRCISACPLALDPVAYSKALDYESRDEKMAILKKEKIMLCMECGCCSYVCPAKRPLVQNNVLAKAQYRVYLAQQKELKK